MKLIETIPISLQELFGETDQSLNDQGIIIHQCPNIDAIVTEPLMVCPGDLDLNKIELDLSIYDKIRGFSD